MFFFYYYFYLKRTFSQIKWKIYTPLHLLDCTVLKIQTLLQPFPLPPTVRVHTFAHRRNNQNQQSGNFRFYNWQQCESLQMHLGVCEWYRAYRILSANFDQGWAIRIFGRRQLIPLTRKKWFTHPLTRLSSHSNFRRDDDPNSGGRTFPIHCRATSGVFIDTNKLRESRSGTEYII